MSDWIEVDQNEINTPIDSGVNFKVFVSPYDIPEAIRGKYENAIQRFVIDFKYFTPEEKHIRKDLDQHVAVFVGKDSNRLHQIAVDVKGMNAQAIFVEVFSQAEAAIEKLTQLPSQKRRRGNYVAARRAIQQNKACIGRELAGAR